MNAKYSSRSHRATGTAAPTAQPWVLEAACRDNPGPWTDSRDKKVKAWAKEQCRTNCPVAIQCWEASKGEAAGIWAGRDLGNDDEPDTHPNTARANLLAAEATTQFDAHNLAYAARRGVPTHEARRLLNIPETT